MKKYLATFSFTETAYVEIEAENEEEAQALAWEKLQKNEVDIANQYDEPDYELELEEI